MYCIDFHGRDLLRSCVLHLCPAFRTSLLCAPRISSGLLVRFPAPAAEQKKGGHGRRIALTFMSAFLIDFYGRVLSLVTLLAPGKKKGHGSSALREKTRNCMSGLLVSGRRGRGFVSRVLRLSFSCV